jgi:hypothetical protein
MQALHYFLLMKEKAMRYRIIFLILITALTVSACNLNSDDNNDGDEQSLATSTPTGRPSVVITTPENGDEFVINDPVLISVSATDSVGVTSVQLFADGQIVRTVSSERATGETQKNVLLDYTPRTAGDVTLRVIAFRGSTSSEPAEVTVTIRSSQSQVTATPQAGSGVPVINPNDPTCRALVNTGLNFRRGPGIEFDIVRVLAAGEVIPIIGRLGDNSWWQLSSGTSVGWVSAGFVTTYGNCSGIPAIAPPPSPTPRNQPTATATNVPIPTSTLVPTNTPIPPAPNLDVTNISGPNSVIIPSGESSVTKSYSVNITNIGGSLNTQFATVARILPGGQSFDVGVAANLGAGQSINLSVNITFDTPGTYILEFATDSDNAITESDETDNSGTYTVTVASE